MRHPDLIWRTQARVAGLVFLACVAGVIAYLCRAPAQPGSAKRTAIRIDCTDAAACTLAESLALDVWSESHAPALPLDIVVTRTEMARLAAAGIRWHVIVDDIDATARAEYERLHDPARAQTADWFAEYRDYRAISDRMLELARLAPDRVTVLPIGASIEGRTIWALRIRGPAPDGKRTKALLNGTLHAREWIAAMVTTCIADRAVRDHDRDPAIKKLLDGTELWVVPVVNPDGYQYSWTGGNRYWRKNRRDRHGVDLNRNFGVAWGGAGSSRNKRSDIYRGEYAFSEPETAALRDLVKREGIAMHVDFHAYGQLLLYPWNHTGTPTKDKARFAAVGDKMASAMFAEHEHRYKLMPGVELYAASGTATDWMYGEAEAMSFTIELRPSSGRGLGGFVLPPDQIRPTCDEALAATVALRTAR